MEKKIVSVYGYGRFGKLWADILSEDHHVKVFSRRGLTPADVTPGQQIVDEKELYNCDALFYCVAISSFEDLLIRSKPLFNPDTVYFDTCSVKVFPVKWMLKNLPAKSQIIGTHPMFGPDSYPGTNGPLPMVMCDIRTEGKTFAGWVEYFSGKKMNIQLMTPDQHDKTVAYSQGITHYLGRVLADLNLKTTPISTLGYKKLLEIIEQTCNDSYQLFLDLQKYNPYTEKMRKDLHNSIEKIYSIFLDK